jgi:succinate dehydrogenase / fumarate reductase flavoprotein subunit
MNLRPLAETMWQGGSLDVGGVAEYFDGGIVVNPSFATNIPGLFAAGECALGPFGANRVCSAITEMLVHGADAGKNAACHASGQDEQKLKRDELDCVTVPAEKILELKRLHRPAVLRRELQMQAHRNLGPVRNQEELEDILSFIVTMKKEQLPELSPSSSQRVYNKEWIDVLELNNMVHLLECSAKCALMRTESRGVHYREDYPYTDNDTWLKESIVTMHHDNLDVEFRTPVITSLQPEEGVIPYFEMLKKMMEAHSEIGGHH